MPTTKLETTRRRPAHANIRWHDGDVERGSRWLALGQRGATIWFTGLSGAGKSTIAAAVEERLLATGRWAYRLDGDNLRHGVCSDLGFSRADRAENARRAAELAALFADAGSVALVSLVSPYADDRRLARKLHEDEGLAFVEVFVNTSLAECARRDVKGLYRQARGGVLANLTGIGAPYETPQAPDVEVTENLDVPTAAALVLAAIPPTGPAARARQHAPRQRVQTGVNLGRAHAKAAIIVRQPTTNRSPKCHD